MILVRPVCFAPRQPAVLALEQQVWAPQQLGLHPAFFAQPWARTSCPSCSLIINQLSRWFCWAQRTVDEGAGKGSSWFSWLRLVSTRGGRLPGVLRRHDGGMLLKARVLLLEVSWNFLVGSVAGAFDTPSRTTALVRLLAGHESSVEDTPSASSPTASHDHQNIRSFSSSRPLDSFIPLLHLPIS